MNRSPRARTINSKGEIVEKPYGAGRWASPRTYSCAHDDCPLPAAVLKAAGSHPAQDDAAVAKAHNCCGRH